MFFAQSAQVNANRHLFLTIFYVFFAQSAQLNAYRQDCVSSLVHICFICETTYHILMKFGIGSLH